ncbi:MAG: hypothetical protein QXY97_06035 [Acidilobaceae archaeon]
MSLFAMLVKEKVYGPVDRLARASDLDMVRVAIYESIRYLSTEIQKGTVRKVPSEQEIREFLDDIERRGVGVARRIAIEALTRGLREQVEIQQAQAQSTQTQAEPSVR